MLENKQNMKNIAVLLGFDVGNILGTSWYQGLIALQGSAACWTRLMGFMAVKGKLPDHEWYMIFNHKRINISYKSYKYVFQHVSQLMEVSKTYWILRQFEALEHVWQLSFKTRHLGGAARGRWSPHDLTSASRREIDSWPGLIRHLQGDVQGPKREVSASDGWDVGVFSRGFVKGRRMGSCKPTRMGLS